MVIVDDVKSGFYRHISRQHVLLLCGMDVDSLCACKILQAMFRADDVEHTVIPVSGKQDVKAAYGDHAHLVKCMVLVNCGGRVNLLELLQPESPEVQFFIVDSHRPLELDNVYNESQVTVVLREGERLNVPEFDELYSSEMEEEGEEDEEVYREQDEPQPKRSRTDEKNSYEARRKRHLWRRKREELLYNYYEMDYHGAAASLVMYELACKLNKDSNEVVWPAIVGLTEQLLYEKISSEVYWDNAFKLQQSVRRHNRGEGDGPPGAINSMRLSFDNELKLALYRHWSFYDSLRHSEYTVTKFKIWSMKGQKKVLEFLATMGMPLSQAEQKFLSMELKFRQNLKQLIDESAPRFSLDNLTYASFVAQIGYKTTLCAADIVYSSTALLEDVEVSYSDAFFTALDSLSMRRNLEIVQEGLELAKLQQVAIMTQVRNFLDTHKVVCAGPFLYAYVEEGTPNVRQFSKILTLGRLARFLRECWVAMNKKARDLPFIVTSPLDVKSVDEGTCLVIGVPPHSDDTRKSEFSRAFQHAANRIQAHATFDHFSGSVVEIKKDERGKFLDTLVQLAAT